jgi:uncharacterized protein YpmB
MKYGIIWVIVLLLVIAVFRVLTFSTDTTAVTKAYQSSLDKLKEQEDLINEKLHIST